MAANKKRVALVSARVEPRQHVPINLLILAGCIEDRADVRVFDPEFDDQELRDIKDFQPDIIGFSELYQDFSLEYLKEIAESKDQDLMYKDAKFQQTISELAVFINEFFEEDFENEKR